MSARAGIRKLPSRVTSNELADGLFGRHIGCGPYVHPDLRGPDGESGWNAFRDLLRFTHVTAYRIDRPPKVDFVARFRPASVADRSPAIKSNRQLFEWVLPHC